MSNNHNHHNHNHSHSHNHHAEIANDSRALKIAMACTASIFIAQVIGGFFSHSLALLSDAGHMLADVGALVIAYLALRFYARSQSDSKKLQRYTFGFRRIEVLAALGVLIYYTHQSWIDSLLSFGISIFIIKSAWRLVRSSGIVLMDSAPDAGYKDSIEKALFEIEGVVSVHDIHVWQISPGENTISAHIVVPSDSHHDDILHEIRTMLEMKFLLLHSTIQIESQNYSDQQHCDSCQLQEKKGHKIVGEKN
ncbi:MAG: cation transporter [Ignavibacteriae bacterium]|nr:cation transporter [Ignavibacteriota bacterium]